MDETELCFIIGHEMGHVALGHAWLIHFLVEWGCSCLPGGAVVITLALRCGNSVVRIFADRAGLLACGSLTKAVSALAQLEVGEIQHSR